MTAATPRSWLFVPGDDPRKIARGLAGEADALIFDWEDAVAAPRKGEARRLTCEAIAGAGEPPAQGHGPQRWVRINALDSEAAAADFAALPASGIEGIVVPKACGPQDALRTAERLAALERGRAGAPGRLRMVLVATETAASVLALSDFRAPVPRLAGLMWGGEDLSADLGVRRNREADGSYRPVFRLARDLTLLAAAATGATAIDAVFTDVRDHAALEAECREARAMGFTAKAAIHPGQVPAIHAGLRPDDEELAWARRVLTALAGTRSGVAMLDGRMIDEPHRRLAHRLVARAAA
jgi:citrate lyase subunit beta / citryl-CoA lyase